MSGASFGPKPEPVAKPPAEKPVEVAEAPKPEPKPAEPEKPAPAPAPAPKPAKPEKKELTIADLDLRGDWPTAETMGEGFVKSPYDGKKINVKGVTSGSLVADPRYGLEERKYFLVP
ncbi:hypothetical protein HAHE_32130 [Haloferula helveola]|uniref:Uncharacterized protein n=2 Tax=Haloferula helveola TaxID=490095 RepID=A0ABN6H6M7_9BACT|nr:hypothetical protein HAHE_32130 [Haloferula helveola]